MKLGGGDEAENVFGGIEQVLKLNWQAPLTRLLVHIGDAQNHGDFEHPGSEARNTAQKLLYQLKCVAKVYTYLYMKTPVVTDGLEKMIKAFKVSLLSIHRYFRSSVYLLDNTYFVMN